MIMTPRQLIMLLFLGVPFSFVSAAWAESYKLGVNDRLNVRVYQWVSAEGVVLDWPSASGEFVVGPDGALSIPMVGQIEANGQTTSDIATVIADELLQNYALTDPPSVSVEVAKFRPFFIGGDVTTSGQYDYIPGLTVGQAVTLAGGTVDMSRNSLSENRIFLSATGTLRVLQAERDRLLVKRARLEAEEKGLQAVVAPKGVSTPKRLDLIMAGENDILKTRILQLKSDLEGLERQKKLLEAEAKALEEKEENLARQREIGQQELEQSQKLISRGLAASSRVNEDERYLVDLDSRILDLSTELLRARQGIAEIDARTAALQVERDAEVHLESQKVDEELEEIERRIVTEQSIVAQAAGNIADLGGQGADLFSIEYRISRLQDGTPENFAVDEWAEVKPGDVLEVKKTLMPMQ